ncbi:MAG: PilN domain-containing protein [Thermodesulfobacteriota bacterium]
MSHSHFGDTSTSRDMRSDLRRIGRTLKHVLAFSPANEVFILRKQISIAVGMDCLSIAHGSRFFNRVRIIDFKTYRTQELSYPSPDTVASTASLYCVQAKLADPQVMLCIPKAWTVIQTTELPAAVREHLPEVVACELDRITPFGPDDAYYDYRILKEAAGKLQIAVAASKKETLDPYIRALAERGLAVKQIDTGLAAVSTCLHYAWREDDLIYLDIGHGTYECGLIQSGVIVSGHAGSFNGSSPDESHLAEVAEQIVPWIEKMEQQDLTPQLMVHSHNGIPYAPLERQLRIPVQALNDANLVLPGVKGETARDDVPHGAVGGILSSLWAKSKAMNLLQSGRAAKTATPLALTVVLVAALLLMGLLTLYLPLHLEGQRVASIDQEIAARKDAIKKFDSLRKEYSGLLDEFNAVEGFRRGKQQTLQIVRELTVILPGSVWLTRVHLSDANVSIEGYATSATDILPRIEASPFFSKVEFTSPTIRDARMNRDRFVIRAELEGVKREEPKGKNGKKQ